MLAKLLGEEGTVTGVDATAAQLAIANRHLDCHRDRFGFAKSNVCFVEGDIESLDALNAAIMRSCPTALSIRLNERLYIAPTVLKAACPDSRQTGTSRLRAAMSAFDCAMLCRECLELDAKRNSYN